jgi:RHS repeat-associated protein
MKEAPFGGTISCHRRPSLEGGLGTTTLQNSAMGLTKQTIEGKASYYARTPDGTLIDERLPGSISYNPIYDAQGDIVGLLNSSGALVQTIRYGPYGENTNASGSLAYSATNDPFLFQGGYHTPGGNPGVGNVPNGLYHFGERYYDPTSGWWTQSDPASAPTEYAFVGDDPINAVDPSGEKGGPGVGCHSAEGKRNCRRRIEVLKNGTGSESENIETCGILGGRVGGFFGGVFGDIAGGFFGGIAGQKAAEKVCRAL